MKKFWALILAVLLVFSVPALAQVADGVYEATAQGNNGDVTVVVTIESGKIAKIDYTHAETAGIGDVALEKLSGAIQIDQTTNLDAVSGATNSSNAILTAVRDALNQAGATADEFAQAPAATETVLAEDIDCDIVIVGAGGAGMVAALQAVENGAKDVVILEKMGATGGNTVRSTGGMNATGTPEQQKNEFGEAAGVDKTIAAAKAAYADTLGDLIATVEAQWTAYQEAPEGYFDTVELFMLDTMVGGKDKNDISLVRTLAEQSASGVEWLHSIGADLTSVGAFGGASVKRIHRPVNDEGKTVSVGSYLVPVLTKNCEDSENIRILFETKAEEVLMDGSSAIGVKATNATGTFNVYADAVVLATGGFGANADMVVSYKPELAGFVTTNAPGATGDGIVMGTAVGADTVDMAEIQIHPTVEQKTSALITEGLRGDGAILVNQEGNRFCDEVGTRDVVSAAVIAQTGSYAYLIVDQKMVDASTVIAGYIKKGFTVQGDTPEALAEAMGAPAETLAKTMADWNACVTSGADAEFGRTSFASPLDTYPLYAIQIAPGVHHTMGGLKIDSATQVIDVNGEVIPGLFAAGEVTGGVHGANRLGGNAVADIVVMGRIAGASASAFIQTAEALAA